MPERARRRVTASQRQHRREAIDAVAHVEVWTRRRPRCSRRYDQLQLRGVMVAEPRALMAGSSSDLLHRCQERRRIGVRVER